MGIMPNRVGVIFNLCLKNKNLILNDQIQNNLTNNFTSIYNKLEPILAFNSLTESPGNRINGSLFKSSPFKIYK